MAEDTRHKTVIVACHLYRPDAARFKDLCAKKGLFHAEVLRRLVLDWLKKHDKTPSKTTKEEDQDDLFEDEDEDEEL